LRAFAAHADGSPSVGARQLTSRAMRRFALPGLITLVAAGLLALLAFGIANDGTSDALASQVASGHHPVAPGARMQLPVIGTNKTESLEQLRGHVVMINFAAGWCTACQADAGVVENAEHRLQRAGGTVLGVTFQDSSPDALSYLHQYHMTFPMLHDVNGNLAADYGVTGVPETFIVSPQGRVIELRTYQLTQKWVTQALNQALGQTA
jgi:cytochrome c biogenesis protein CcmG, thiol:disulfide interchange protein DsbE